MRSAGESFPELLGWVFMGNKSLSIKKVDEH